MKRLTLFILVTAITLSCSKNTAPVASFNITPLTGTTDTVFTLDASESTDAESAKNQLQFRWDWESDGLWDTKLSTESIIKHRFLADTTYEVTLQVVDEDGWTDSCKVSVSVNSLTGTFIDLRDGYEYEWVRICCQTWMAENLSYLPTVSPSILGSRKDPLYYVYGYEGTIVDSAKSTDNFKKFGVLYNWSAAMNGAASSTSVPSQIQGICPEGWHLPSWDEYQILSMPMNQDWSILKSVTGWKNEENGDNASGFNAYPGGFRINDIPRFYALGEQACFWSSSENYYPTPFVFRVNNGQLGPGNYPWLNEDYGCSIRCVKNE